jgi:4-hydroxythreonine-4-phosphate dehydrogenase
MSENLIKIGISQGDVNGIAYELILKTFDEARIYESCIPIVYGSSKVLSYHRKTLELPSLNINNIGHAGEAEANRFNVINVTNDEIVVELGKFVAETAKFAEVALTRALQDLKSGHIDILLSAPATADPLKRIEAEMDGENKGLKILVNNSFRIALATDKIPLAEVAGSLSKESLTEKIKILQSSLIQDFMITSPRIAVLSLNPQAGIKQEKGKEEKEIIIPALEAASEAGVFCFGPYAADDFFKSDEYLKFDAILAMYYDQGMIAFQSITSGEGALYTAGLPFIITAPNQGASFDKAGKNSSSPDSFRNALYLATDLFQNRQIDREINSNPLKKQYFERGSDNEKLDLTSEQ